MGLKMAIVVPINVYNVHHEIVEYIFEESERLPNDFYINIMNLMKKYHDQCGRQVYNEIQVYLDKNKKRINSDIFKKIKGHFPNERINRLEYFKKCSRFMYSFKIISLFLFIIFTMGSVIVLAIIRR
jgi:hypothetical protein